MIGLRSKRLITDSIIYIVLTVMVVIWLFPLVWMVLRAFDTNTSNITTSIFPKEFTMDSKIFSAAQITTSILTANGW